MRFIIFCVLSCISVVSNWVVGLWFLFRHPIQFHEFIRIWRGYREDIEKVDEARTAGFFNLNRAQRRRIGARGRPR